MKAPHYSALLALAMGNQPPGWPDLPDEIKAKIFWQVAPQATSADPSLSAAEKVALPLASLAKVDKDSRRMVMSFFDDYADEREADKFISGAVCAINKIIETYKNPSNPVELVLSSGYLNDVENMGAKIYDGFEELNFAKRNNLMFVCKLLRHILPALRKEQNLRKAFLMYMFENLDDLIDSVEIAETIVHILGEARGFVNNKLKECAALFDTLLSALLSTLRKCWDELDDEEYKKLYADIIMVFVNDRRLPFEELKHKIVAEIQKQ